jgi:predicted Zn-dependent protease
VAKRDPLALLARRIGLSALTAVLTGGQGGTLGQGIMQELVNARYSRKAEDRADGFAVDLLASSGLAPTSFAAALRRIKETTPKSPALLQYLDPHSPVDQRIRHVEERARKASARGRWGTTGMSPLTVDWTAVVEALSAGGKTSRGE